MTNTADLTKVVFNPSKSVTFVPVAKKQMVMVEVTNNCTSDVAVKFKNTGPTVYKTTPPQAKIGVGEKKMFSCIFKGLPKEQCKTNDRFTVVFIAASKNVVIEKAWKNAHKTATLKHKIAILFQGVNDQKENETQQPTANDDEEDKDRQGQMRTKKTEMKPPPGKKATVVMFMRKEGESVSDEEEDDGTSGAQPAPTDDMMTTRPAGPFNNVNQNAPPAGAAAAAAAADNDLKTTRPAGTFNNQTTANAAAAAKPADPKSELKTTKPAGNFNGQVAANAPKK
uniref:Major sperm protein n=1 Tax=Caenorhabditis japonica TaxID=281687 RepID=A0A8R1DYU4_CAEJA